MVDQGDGSFSLVDSWGNEYFVMMDADGDKEINVPGVTELIRADVVVWSYGKPDDKADHTSAQRNDPDDWIKSW